MADSHKTSVQVRIPIDCYNKLKKMIHTNQRVSGVIMDLVNKNYKPRNTRGQFVNKGDK